MRVMVITSSRAVDDTRAAQLYATVRLWEAMDIVRPRYVVHGGAPGGDMLADSIARALRIHRVVFDLDGYRYLDESKRVQWTTRTREELGPKQWPLHRNEKMVDFCESVAGVELCIYGVWAPWSKTQGTLHTARLRAKSDAVRVWVDEVPWDYSPEGVLNDVPR